MRSKLATIAVGGVTVFGLSGCGDPAWVEAYEDCKAQVEQKMSELEEQPSSGNEQADALAKSFAEMGRKVALSACETIKTSCEDDPEGQTCQSIVQEYNSQP